MPALHSVDCDIVTDKSPFCRRGAASFASRQCQRCVRLRLLLDTSAIRPVSTAVADRFDASALGLVPSLSHCPPARCLLRQSLLHRATSRASCEGIFSVKMLLPPTWEMVMSRKMLHALSVSRASAEKMRSFFATLMMGEPMYC